jgi:hypothetical protein
VRERQASKHELSVQNFLDGMWFPLGMKNSRSIAKEMGIYQGGIKADVARELASKGKNLY